MKITSFKKNCSKDTFLFSGSLKSVQSYYTKDNIEMIILTCYNPQCNCDILFSNYRNVFDKYVSEELLS